MRRILRTAGGVTVAAAVLLLVAPVPASAGGPTSVILVSPGRQATASLYTSDEAYGRLSQLVGENPGASDPAAPDLTGGPGSDAVNVTWLIHDVQIWRVDRIFTSAKDGPWIETTMINDGKSLFDGKGGVRHKAADGQGLLSMLSALRLLGSTPQPEAFQGAKAPAAERAVNQPVQPVAAADRPAADLNWLWLLIGVGAGVTLMVGFRPLVRRLRPN
jgi:hypothetical protein